MINGQLLLSFEDYLRTLKWRDEEVWRATDCLMAFIKDADVSIFKLAIALLSKDGTVVVAEDPIIDNDNYFFPEEIMLSLKYFRNFCLLEAG